MKRPLFIPSSPAPLEERITPSPAGLAGLAATPVAFVQQSHNLDLNGFVLGRDTTVGTVHWLHQAGGTISPFSGTVKVTGFLVIPNSHNALRSAHGFVTISNAKGSLTVSLKGTVTVSKGPFTFASGNLTYKVVAGTKADHGATGTGKVLYGPGPVFQPGKFLLNFGNSTPPP
jgi:hypothetical protein